MVFHTYCINYTTSTYSTFYFKLPQYKNRVKDLGSFRLIVGNPHFHGLCNFTEFMLETVKQSLRHSCRTELTRQGISLPKDSYS